MDSSATAVPIACCPTALAKQERERSRALRTELAGVTTKVADLPGGLAFSYRDDTTTFLKIAEWIALERRCCPFFTFDLRWEPGEGVGPTLAITGPEGVKDFLAAEMPELPREPT